MYYGDTNPFGRDSYRTLMIKDTRRAFSRFHFGILAYVVSAYVISILFDAFLLIFAADSYEAFTSNIYYQWIMGVLPMYAVGLPLLYLTVRNMPVKKLEKKRMKIGEFLVIFAIAQTLMAIGNTVGTTLNGFFAAIKGDEITNTTSELIENSPIWLTIVVAVVIGPIIEEFIFRKLMIDRLSRYGCSVVILTSGISFGLFHGNFYQFFYAALLGMLLAFVTIKTGNWLYSVALHILINFFGSVAAMPFMDMAAELEGALSALENGALVDAAALIQNASALISYLVIQYALIVAGAVFLALAIKNKWYSLKSTAEVNIPREDIATSIILNTGTLLFFGVSLVLFAVSIILG